MYGAQSLPVDVCPQTYITRDLLCFERQEGLHAHNSMRIVDHSFDTQLANRNYGYTMSITFFVDRNTCNIGRAGLAESHCHIVLLENVFMLYFSRPNAARFHFFAERNYYES